MKTNGFLYPRTMASKVFMKSLANVKVIHNIVSYVENSGVVVPELSVNDVGKTDFVYK